MTNLDTNPTTFRVPTPNPIQLVSGPTTWFHVPRPRYTHMAAMPHASLSGTAVESLLRWVLHQSALYTLELRLCGSGQHGGIWLGLTGRGATPRHAAQVSHEGRQMFASFFQMNHWSASIRRTPKLPRWTVGLCTRPDRSRLDSVQALLPQRASVQAYAERGVPLVLQMRMEAGTAAADVYQQASRLEQALDGTVRNRQARNLHNRHQTLLRNLQDDAVDLSVTVHLSAARAPSSLRLRQLAAAFPESRVAQPWGPTATPTPATLAVMRDALALMAGKEAA